MSPSPLTALTTPMTLFIGSDEHTMTLRQYLIELLSKVWEEAEGFNGKRPWGDSGWQGDVEVALIRAGILKGTLDEDGYLEESDPDVDFEEFMQECIKAL